MSRASSTYRVSFATCSEYPQGSEDDRIAVRALRAEGIEAVPAVWDGREPPWGEFDATVLRSTWDYPERWREFLAWAEAVQRRGPLWNPLDLVRWNLDKGYLLEIARRGFDVVPTERVRADRPERFSAVVRRTGWSHVVVKPAIGLAGRGLGRFGPKELERGEAHLARLLEHGDALVQPFQDAVSRLGERSLVFLEGRFSHAVSCPAVMSQWEKAPSPYDAPATEVARWAPLLEELPGAPLYARVDLLPDDRGRWRLGELELIEPELFFRSDRRAAPAFARAIRARLASG